MNNYNTIILNDVTNIKGISVSFYVQGCPHHCKGCFNPETWDFNGGQPYTEHTKWEIIEAIGANGLQRNFSVLGGEPLAPQNLQMVDEVVAAVRAAYPKITIALWTGYTFEKLNKDNSHILSILNKINYIIDGQFIEELKDLNLYLRGSSNQRIWMKREDGTWDNEEKKEERI